MEYQWFERGAFATKKARKYLAEDFSPQKIQKIAVIRHAALGDQVITRPFLIEARKYFPNAQITLVAVSNYQYGMPDDLVDRVHIMPGKDKKEDTSVFDKIKNIIDLGEQDIIFDLASTNRSHWMMALSKAKLKIGFPYKYYLRGVLYNVCVPRSDFQPEVECMLDMLKLLGHNPTYPLNFNYPDNRVEIDREEPFILFFNGASQTSKILSQQQMKELIELSLESHSNIKHIFLEGKNTFEKGDFLEGLKKYSNFSIQACLPLEELIKLVAKASILVSPDTGVRNVAIATHTPTVGIFYSTVPFRYTPNYEKHYIVMTPDGSIPSTQKIYQAIKNEVLSWK
ncbi:glycosyltransferase family 9 protein [Vibrio mangrovi]|uniref:ADP-heptose:LPS heptosyl transferase I n=1 Tax=Vibrio mangrovi TaxID=474394 RepID=A0A1Y6IX11_9VIBR|nr:glycosyltransferase family 9 protein [Vibrio mangrovi]MDW6002206.1 glycosyltransferase family 9 protein [Vibrio mangrovi]SMS01551.1 ADP-heptose:LPS heptosyl transferase I [Vibrio mangrovi]